MSIRGRLAQENESAPLSLHGSGAQRSRLSSGSTPTLQESLALHIKMSADEKIAMLAGQVNALLLDEKQQKEEIQAMSKLMQSQEIIIKKLEQQVIEAHVKADENTAKSTHVPESDG